MTHKPKFIKGRKYVCTHATSPGYTQDKEYTVYLNEKAQLCIKGDDGIEDLVSMLVSTFKESDRKMVVLKDE